MKSIRFLNLHKLEEILPLFCQVLWALWIAAVAIPTGKSLLIFSLIALLLFALMNLVTHFMAKQENHKLSTIEFMAVLVLLIAGLIALTSWLTIWLASIMLIFFIAHAYFFNRQPRISRIFYAATWAWIVPLCFAAQHKDIETTTWLLTLNTFFWTLTYRNALALRHNPRITNLPLLALLYAITFGFLILTGMFSGQGFWYFIGLIIVLVIFIFQLDLVRKNRAAEAYPYHSLTALLILLGIVLSYRL